MTDRPPPWRDQRDAQLRALRRAVAVICESWDDALAESRARGYSSQSPGPRAAGVVHIDPKDPLHARQMAPAGHQVSASGDPTGNAAGRPTDASGWLSSAKRLLVLVLWASTADATGERRWTGSFHPPSMMRSLYDAAGDVVDMWPRGTSNLIERAVRLADEARRRWPPTPKAGETVDGIVVGERAPTVETCTECHGPIAGGAGDPLRRIDGKPYHMSPCWETVRSRMRRRRVVSTA